MRCCFALSRFDATIAPHSIAPYVRAQQSQLWEGLNCVHDHEVAQELLERCNVIQLSLTNVKEGAHDDGISNHNPKRVFYTINSETISLNGHSAFPPPTASESALGGNKYATQLPGSPCCH